jgi:hypothetical protein
MVVRESGGTSHAEKWRPPFWRPTDGGRRSLPLSQTFSSTSTPHTIQVIRPVADKHHNITLLRKMCFINNITFICNSLL